MTRAELVEAARGTGEMIDALVARLAEVGATLTSVSDEINQMQTKHAELTTALENYEREHFVVAGDVTAVYSAGEPLVTEVVVTEASGPSSLIEVGPAVPEGAGETSIVSSTRMQFVPAEGFKAAASYNYTLALDSDPEAVRSTASVALTAKVVLPPPTGWVCPKPHRGPIRDANGNILLCNNLDDPSVSAFRKRIPKLFVGSVYTVGAHMGARDGGFDHSEAGIKRHAAVAFDSFMQRRGGEGGTRNLWFDVEADMASINVPASVGYSVTESVSKYRRPGYANTYDFDVEKPWRYEAIRFFRQLSEALIAEAKKANFKGFEIGSYNHPAETSFRNFKSNDRYTIQAAELNEHLLCPVFAYAGGNCYLASGTSADGLSPDGLVKRAIAKCKYQVEKYRAAIPRPQKIIPAIFNCWVGPDVNGETVLPKGALGKLAETILDAGADGLYVYENTDPANRLPHAQDRYNEVIDVILARGDFVNPYD